MSSKWIEIFAQNTQSEKTKKDYFIRIATLTKSSVRYVAKRYWQLNATNRDQQQYQTENIETCVNAVVVGCFLGC